MSLEFHKLTEQVDRMGQILAHEQDEIESKVDLALQIMEAHADESFLGYILERVQDAVEKDAGYRGARPLDEPIMESFAPAELPEAATVIATDGSQIAPNTHGAALYYLINIGTIILHHGSGEPPEIVSEPALYYEKEYLVTQDRSLITNGIVGARRTVAEMAALAEHGWYQRGETRPLVTLFDGSLLFLGISSEVPDRDQLYAIYFSAMTRLHEVNAALAGYIDRPRSTYITGMLHLLDLPEDHVSRATLASDGRLEGLQDIAFLRHLLGPSERSALFIQMSPQNKDFRRQMGETHEIAFFYMNVAGEGEFPKLCRIELPMWVAEDRMLVAKVQALVYHQCQQVVRRYPYLLTRADELAVVKADESRHLNSMIKVALTRYGLDSLESEKQAGKDVARSYKTRFEVRG